MSEYNHIDKKEYLIAEGPRWRIWNNGIVEKFYSSYWKTINSYFTWERRLKFVKLWEKKAEIDKSYSFGWDCIVPNRNDIKFLGFKQPEECPECKKSYMVWEGKIQLCKRCEYIHAFEYDDS